MFDEEMITKYRYIILLLGTAASFVLGFAVAFALAKLCGVMVVKAVLNIAFTVIDLISIGHTDSTEIL